jgi:tRNA(fMet)-specific endonuclease VapC
VTRYLLDTNIVSALVRAPQGPVAAKIAEVGDTNVCTSITVAAGLRFGAAKKGSNQLTTQLQTILSVLDTLPLDSPDDDHYAHIRVQVESAGTPIEGNDLLIAAQVIALGCTLVTDQRMRIRSRTRIALRELAKSLTVVRPPICWTPQNPRPYMARPGMSARSRQVEAVPSIKPRRRFCALLRHVLATEGKSVKLMLVSKSLL